MRLAIDIETAPAPGWETYERAALDHNRNRITLIATYDGTSGRVFRDIESFNRFISSCPSGVSCVFHNGKFDLKTLITQGAALTFDDLHDDTQLMAVAHPDKIPDPWLVQYGMRRKEANEQLGQNVHREAGKHSLKTLAPYHLGVAPFWEVADHDNEEYALKDVTYTYKLAECLEAKLKEAGAYEFYKNRLIPWACMIGRAELAGIALDQDLMAQKEKEAEAGALQAKRRLDEMWAGAYQAYRELQEDEVRQEYTQKMQAAVERLKDKSKAPKTAERYLDKMQKALDKIEPLNLDSPTQLTWLLRDHLGLDISTFKGDDESTGKPVLKRLGVTRPDVSTFLDYRQHTKLATAFFPSYRSMQMRGAIYCGFNLNGTRTGRLSSSEPNLQQVPGSLHPLFIPRPGNKLICYDLSAIEPTVVAYLTEDHELCDLLINGGNFHSNNVRIFLGINATDKEIKENLQNERAMAKEVALALMYGAGSERIRESAQKFGMTWSQQFCREVHKRFKERYETVFRYKRELDKVLERGGTMQNAMGRILKIPYKQDVYMQGFNTLVQSSASDMLLDAACRADASLRTKGLYTPRLFVHDEVVAEAPEAHAELVSTTYKMAMEAFKLPTAYGLIPVKAEGGLRDKWEKG